MENCDALPVAHESRQPQPLSWSGWNDDLTEVLRHLASKKYSSRSISAILGTTRGSVIGKCHREGIQLLQCQGRAKPGERRPTPGQPRGLVERKTFPPVEPLNIPFGELTADTCRYPTTDDKPFAFCGHPVEGESPYCGFHHQMCHLKPHQYKRGGK